MALTHRILDAKVVHARTRPKRNRFCYRVYYLCLRLSDWEALTRIRFLSLDRFNLFSLNGKDYFAGKAQSPQQWIQACLTTWGVTKADGEIVLMTMPRVLGYAFNPVSFWFCLDRAGALRAVLADVSNTFGERHAYLLQHGDQSPIHEDDWLESDKLFHVSPFLEIKGHYRFRVAYQQERVGVWIDYDDGDGIVLHTSVVGTLQPLTALALLRRFFFTPLVTVKVIALIHYQALRLFLKGVRYYCKPLPPSTEISR